LPGVTIGEKFRVSAGAVVMQKMSQIIPVVGGDSSPKNFSKTIESRLRSNLFQQTHWLKIKNLSHEKPQEGLSYFAIQFHVSTNCEALAWSQSRV